MDLPTPSFSHILWIGGSPCSGKTTLASLLAKQYELTVYHCDEHWEEHLERVEPDAHPTLHAIKQMTWDDIWMRPIEEQVMDVLAAYREEYEMILDDLLALPHDVPLIAEGTALLPDLVLDTISDPRQAVWVVPTEAFQRQTYRNRGEWVGQVLSQCSDPDQAFENWMARDAEFARWVARSAAALGLDVLTVSGEQPAEETAEVIARLFQLADIDE